MANEADDPDFTIIHALAVGLLEGTLTPAQQEQLDQLLLENATARRAYIEHVQESACLRWLCAEEFAETAVEPNVVVRNEGVGTSDRRNRRLALGIGGLLATVALVVTGMQFLKNPQDGQVVNMAPPAVSKANAAPATGQPRSPLEIKHEIVPDHPIVATVTAADGVRSASPAKEVKVLSRWSVGDRVLLERGSAELTFDAGAQVTVFGPAEFEITSATSIRCVRGRVTTLVDKRGRGFSIETPKAKVVDLGTQFGLSITENGETEVVVFQGEVDLSSSEPATADSSKRRLQQGDALLVRNSGAFERVVAVQRDNFMGGSDRGKNAALHVIGDLRDNIRTGQNAKSYQIVHGGLEDDAPAFVDRNHEWNGMGATGLPHFLAGADYIMPFNDDKFLRDLELKLTLLQPATVYVFLDNNMPVPPWLHDEFEDTGVDIGLDCAKTIWHKDHVLEIGGGRSVDFSFSVWKREVKQAGIITLGGVEPPENHDKGFNMYGVAAVPTE